MMLKLKKAIEIVAKEEIMPRYADGDFGIKSDGSLQTPADLAAQKKLEELLQDVCPASFLGEEMTKKEQMRLWESSRELIWCVDPIDGTSNYVNGIPYFAVSVALMKKGETLLGAVYDPTRQEMFYAEKDGGAFLNGVKLSSPMKNRKLGQAMAQIDFKRLPKDIASELLAHTPYASQRNFGAGALEWCYLASGRFDIYLHGSQKLWDYAAGSLILAESGGIARTIDSENFWDGEVWSKSVVAANSAVMFEAWVDWLKAALPQIIR